MGNASSAPPHSPPAAALPVRITVVEYSKHADKEWVSGQERYVCLQYDESEFRTKDCIDGHHSTVFEEEILIRLVEGLWWVDFSVWNENSLGGNHLIGRGRISLQTVLFEGYDNSLWVLQSENGRYAGELQLLMEASFKRAIVVQVPPTPMAAESSIPLESAYRQVKTPVLVLQATVVDCKKLTDTARQMSPYVCFEYANSSFKTENCFDVTFGDEFVITLVKGLWEINVSVWNSNTIRDDYLIGSGRILLQEVLSRGYDDSLWALQGASGRYAGVIRVTMQLLPRNAIALEEPSTSMAADSSEAFEAESVIYRKPAVVPYSAPAYPSIPPAAPYAPAHPASQPDPFSYMREADPVLGMREDCPPSPQSSSLSMQEDGFLFERVVLERM